MIQNIRGRVSWLAFRILGLVTAVMTVVAAGAAIRSAAEWQGLRTVAAIVGLCALCLVTALATRFFFGQERGAAGVGTRVQDANLRIPSNQHSPD